MANDNNTIQSLNIKVTADAQEATKSLGDVYKVLNNVKKLFTTFGKDKVSIGDFTSAIKEAQTVSKEMKAVAVSAADLAKAFKSHRITAEDIGASELAKEVSKLKDAKKSMDDIASSKAKPSASFEDGKEMRARAEEYIGTYERTKAKMLNLEEAIKAFTPMIKDLPDISSELSLSQALKEAEALQKSIEKARLHAQKQEVLTGRAEVPKEMAYDATVDTLQLSRMQQYIRELRQEMEETAKAAKPFEKAFEEMKAKITHVPDIPKEMGLEEAEKEAQKLWDRLEKSAAAVQKQKILTGSDVMPDKFVYDSAYDAKKLEALLTYIKKLKEESGSAEPPVKSFSDKLADLTAKAQAVQMITTPLGKMFDGVVSGAKKAASGVSSLIRTFKKLTPSMEENRKSFAKNLKTILKYTFSVRSTYFLIRRLRNAIKEGYGNLGQYSEEAAVASRGLSAAVLTLKNAFAAGFSPISNLVLPLLQAFVNGISAVLNAIGRFLSVLTGKGFAVQAIEVTGNAMKSVESGAKGASKAVKELQENLSVLSFDELNQLSADSSSGSGGSGGGGGGTSGLSANNMFTTVTTDTSEFIQKWADDIRKAFKAKDWEGLGTAVASGLNRGISKIYKVLDWEKVKMKVLPFIDAFATSFYSLTESIDFSKIGGTLARGLNVVTKSISEFIGKVDWKHLGERFANGLNGFLAEFDASALGKTLVRKFKVAWDMLSGFIANIDYSTLGTRIGELLNSAIEGIDLPRLGNTLGNLVAGLFNGLGSFINTFSWEKLASDVSNGINNFFNRIDWDKAGATFGRAIKKVFETMYDVVANIDWEKIGQSIGTFLSNIDWVSVFTNTFKAMGTAIFGLLKGLSQSIGGWIVIALSGLKVISSTVNKFVAGANWYSGVKKAFGVFGKASNDAADSVEKATRKMEGSSVRQSRIATGIANSFTGIFSAISTGTTMSLGSIALLTAGLASAVIAIGTIGDALRGWDESYGGLTKHQEHLIKDIELEAEAWRRTKQAREEALSGIESQYSYYQETADRLREIVDANGKVKKGYEEEAETITGVLSDALGIQIDLVDGQIKNYQQLNQEIDKTIQKRKAEAMLSAYESSYTEALQKRQEGYKRLKEAQDEYTRGYDLLKQLEAEAIADPNNRDKIKAWEEQKDVVIELREELETAQRTYEGYNETIRYYEELQTALISGNSKRIADALLKVQTGFKTAKTATKTELEAQRDYLKSILPQMEKDCKNGMNGVTQEMVDSVKNMVSQTEKELEGLEEVGKYGIDKYWDTVIDGINNPWMRRAFVQSLGGIWQDTTDEPAKRGAKDGAQYGSGVANGVESPESMGKYKTASRNAQNAISSEINMPNGMRAASSWVSGMNSSVNSGSAVSVGKALMTKIKEGMLAIRMPQLKVDPNSWLGKNVITGLDNFINFKWNARGGIFNSASIIGYGVGEAGAEAILPLENKRTMNMIADSIMGSGANLTERLVADLTGAMLTGNGNNQEVIVNATLYTENNEVLARAVQRGQKAISYRNGYSY